MLIHAWLTLLWFQLIYSVTYLQFKMREPQMCNVVCKLKLDAKIAKEFKEKIDDEYRVNMYAFQ